MANDFRGYVQSTAPEFLNYVGNDITGDLSHGVNFNKLKQAGGIDSGYMNQSLNYQGAIDAIKKLYTGYAQNQAGQSSSALQGIMNALGGAMGGSINISAPQAPLAPQLPGYLDVNALRAQAAKSVNPLYDLKLNQYLQNEAAGNAEQQQQNKLTIGAAQAQLANTQQSNELTRQFSDKKNELSQNFTNSQEKGYQQQQGAAFDQKRQAMMSAEGQGGLTGSGIASQQLWQAENQRHIEESQQEGQFQYTRDQANLEKTNTFNQLAQSDAYSKTFEGKQESQANFDLNSYLRQSAYQEQTFRQSNEEGRQAAIGSQANNLGVQQLSSWLQGLHGPTQQAAYSAYGGMFR